MVIAIGSDHGGFEYKAAIVEYLKNKGHNVLDVGTNSKDSCHYPIYGAEVSRLVSKGDAQFGILVCTTGEGMCMVANKIHGVRCGIGYSDEATKLMRQHNNANIISFGQSQMDLTDVIKRIDIFLSTPFEGGRHKIRVDMLENFSK